nr:tRNA(Ile)-lysidine synthetase [Spirochaetota bacterium]
MRDNDDAIIRRVKAFAMEHGMLRKRDRLLLSLSAGKDSVALLDIMSQLADSLELTLGIFHMNHLSRGKDSDDDERFVMELAKSKGLKLYIERIDCAARPRGKSFED